MTENQPHPISDSDAHARRQTFRDLHSAGTFVMPNPWDAGSARILAAQGFPALATTSGGFAMSLGRPDGYVSRDELVSHVANVCAATDLPVNVDAEQCFPDDPGGVAATVELLAAAGASGVSIEDWSPTGARIVPLGEATEQVAIAAQAAESHGVVITARAENHLRGVDDLDDTIARLQAYRDAGASCLYAPLLTTAAQVERVVAEVDGPINVLLLPHSLTIAELTELGVRRISVGGMLARTAYGALAEAAQGLLDLGTYRSGGPALDPQLAARALRAD